MNLFTLQAIINLSHSEYKKSLKESLSEANTFSEKFKAVITSDVYNTWVLVGQAIIEVGKKINQLMTQSLQFADQQGEMAAKLGVSTEAIGEMQYIATQTGTTIEGLQSSMSALYLRAKSDGDAFKQLGISVTDTSGQFKSMDDLFYETIGALNTLEDENAKNSYMLDLFGRSAMTNGEILRKSTDEIEAMKQQAHDLGIVLDESTTDFAGAWFDRLDALKLQGQGVLVSLVAGEDGAEEKLQNFLDNIVEMLETNIPTFVNFAVKLLLQVALALIRIAPSLAIDIVSAIQDVIIEMDWLQFGVDLAKAILEGLINTIVSKLNQIFGAFGVDIPKVDLGVGENVFNEADLGAEYEISENIRQDINVRVEASGDSAVSEETAEKTAEALAPYIDKILGGK